MSAEGARAALQTQADLCTGCGACVKRCEVLRQGGEVTIGALARMFAATGAVTCDTQDAQTVFRVRRCCMCGMCTARCPRGVEARKVFSSIRELFALSGVTTEEGFESTRVDREWHVFSVYRAVCGISYADLPHLDDAVEIAADTLFFPGCFLASYAPELCHEVFAALDAMGVKAVIDESCCGSPLRAGGFLERSRMHREHLAERIAQAGIRRIVLVCPGCSDELSEVAESMPDVELVPLPALLAQAEYKPLPEKLAALADVRDAAAPLSEKLAVPAPAGDVAAPRLATFDSCHDRDQRFGVPIRAFLAGCETVELVHAGKDARCCGAGGAVALADPDICARRARRVFDEAKSAGADVLVTVCPTCSYTFAAEKASAGIPTVSYLELMFHSGFAWDAVFAQLNGMWTGEYGRWVCQQLL